MDKPPSFLIFGLGYLGKPLAQRLYRHGFAVRGIKRTPDPGGTALPFPTDIQTLDGNSGPEVWTQYSCWIFLLPPSKVAAYAATHAHLIRLAEQGGVAHLVFAGSVSVYGSATRICDEGSERRPETESARAIADTERLLLESRIPHTDILHLGGLYSAERHPLTSLLKRTAIPGRRHPVNMLHRDRAVEGLFQAACRPLGRRILNLVETPHPDKETFYRREAAKMGTALPDFDPDDDTVAGKTVISRYALNP